MRVVLWLAAACAVVLAVLALSRGIHFTSEPVKKDVAPSVQEAVTPAVAKAPEVPPSPPKPAQPPTTEIDPQVAEDAAAVGMTTREPTEEGPAPEEAPKKAPQ